MKNVVAFDTETYLIGPGDAVAPKVVCASFASRIDGVIKRDLLASCDDSLPVLLHSLFDDPDTLLVGHNTAYDLTVIARTWPHLLPVIFKALDAHRVTDTRIREKLLNLSTIGKIDKLYMPDGSEQKIAYSLAALVLNRFGEDRSEEKNSPDAWRLRYSELDGKPISEYPEEASRYAIQDAIDTLRIWEEQEKQANPTGPGSMTTHTFQTSVDFALRLMTVRGFKIDQEHRDKLAAELAVDLHEDNLQLLIQSGILRPSEPPRAYKNGKGTTKGKPTSINTKRLGEVIVEVCEKNGREVKKTATDQVAADAGTITELAPYDERLAEYQKRQALARLAGTELPKLAADSVHPNFDILKETGRTSSYGNRKEAPMEPYPATNIQQVDPRARGCFVARPGFVICSIDYSALELVALAQKTKSLFGYSVHWDKVMAGYDLHAFLGAQLAWHFDEEFREWSGCDQPDDIYREFLKLKSWPGSKKFFGHWRKFAKPTGLGFPGGLGPDTFVTYAKDTYDVLVTREEAVQLRQIWFAIYLEMKDYFQWVNRGCKDPYDPDSYCYSTPLGMYRAGATYCACANGAALQSPAAEGAKLAVFEVAKACYVGDLKGCYPQAFIHDEILLEIPEGPDMGEKADKVAEIWKSQMHLILPDVPIGASPCLMRRWDKAAEPVRDEKGRLQIWSPSS